MPGNLETNLEVAERIGRLLDEKKLLFVVIGAVALAAHRYIRFTEDIDLGVNADLRQMRAIAETLRSEGYEVVLYEPDAQDPLGGVIDVSGPFGLVQIISFENRFPAVIRDALAGEDIRIFPGSTIRVVPIPQLVALKLYAGGWKSQADIIELLRRNPEIDREMLRQICSGYGLLGLDDLLKELPS